jgi:hypothetical protein
MSPHYVNMANKKNWIMGEKFEARMAHHHGIKELWEKKWKFPVGEICLSVLLRLY